MLSFSFFGFPFWVGALMRFYFLKSVANILIHDDICNMLLGSVGESC
jgi:hypothetical protein